MEANKEHSLCYGVSKRLELNMKISKKLLVVQLFTVVILRFYNKYLHSTHLNSFSNFYLQLIILWKTGPVGSTNEFLHHAQFIVQKSMIKRYSCLLNLSQVCPCISTQTYQRATKIHH
jgi:hypothetical protein